MHNSDLMLRIANKIETSPSQFEMGLWIVNDEADYTVVAPSQIKALSEDCGTKACIAGWAVLLEGWRDPETLSMDTDRGYLARVHASARDLLGIDHSTGLELFLYTPPEHAPQVLRLLAEETFVDRLVVQDVIERVQGEAAFVR